jgi:hypothetical protein
MRFARFQLAAGSTDGHLYLLVFFLQLEMRGLQAIGTVNGCPFIQSRATLRACEGLYFDLFTGAALLAPCGQVETFELVELLLGLGQDEFFTTLTAAQLHISFLDHLKPSFVSGFQVSSQADSLDNSKFVMLSCQ